MELKKYILFNSLLTLAYYLCGKLVGMLSFPPVGATPLWIPAGLAVGAALIWGYRMLPGAFMGDFLIGLDLYGVSQHSLLLATSLGLQSALLAGLAVFMARKCDLWPTYLAIEKQIIRFYLIAGLVAPLLPSILIVAVLFVLGEIATQNVFQTLGLWWLGSAIGIVTFTPVLLTFFAQPRDVWRSRIYNVGLPTLALFVILIVVLDIAKSWDHQTNYGRFRANVDLVNTAIDHELTYHEAILSALSAFFLESDDVTAQEFIRFIQEVSPHGHDSQLLGWIERQHNADNPSQTALVMKYVQSFNTDKQTDSVLRLKGHDLCELDTGRYCDGILSKTDTTRFQTILNEALADPSDYIYLLPVEKQGELKGFLFFEYTHDVFFSWEQQDAIKLIDFVLTNLASGKVIHHGQNAFLPISPSLDLAFKTTRIIHFADQNWKLELYPSQQFIQHYASWTYYWVVVIGLFAFLLAGIWLMTMTGRYNLVEHQVDEKTKELKERTRLLAKSEEKYRHLVESIQDEYFLYSHDTDGYFDYISPSIQSILGYSQQEFLNHYSTYMPDTEINKTVTQNTLRTLSGQKSNYQVEILSKTGEIHTLALTEMPRFDEQGNIVGVEGIAHDITDLKASHLELEKLSMAVKHSPNAVIIFDKEGVIEYVNPKFTAITGYTKGESSRWPDLINSEINAPNIYHDIWKTIRAGDEWRGELQNRKKNGELYWAQELIAPMLNEQGEVTHYVATQVDITEARRLNEETSYQASHDLLTGLINRREFDRRLERVIQTAKRDLSEHALCFLDLDQFKVINDTCGHIAGDELLRQIGGVLQTNVRSRDTVARLGGDEFAILMEHCAIDQAYKACEQLLELLQDFRFHWQEYTFTIGGSIGLMVIDHYTLDSNEALRSVDTACYAAKDAGRNRVEVHREDSERLQQRRGEIRWSAEISEALDHDRFVLYAQPIKSLLNPEQNLSYEILVRMIRRDGELSPPGAFLPAAERYNSMTRIDRWVVTHTLNWLSEHAEQLNHVDTFSINLSGLTLGDSSMLDFIVSTIELSDVPTEKIKFEITETAAIANLRTATSLIEQLHDKGILFSLDDFGSGLSSFAYLKQMKVDALKIDGIFVKDMLDDPLDYEMVRSINEIGHVMGLRTIAEFVESEAIMQKLREIGVDYVQGYAIGKPVPIDQIHDSGAD